MNTAAVKAGPLLAAAPDIINPDGSMALPRPLDMTPAPVAVAASTLVPQAQAYAVANPLAQSSGGQVLVPISLLINGLGVSAGPVEGGAWRVAYFEHSADFYPGQSQATFDDNPVTLTPAPRVIGDTLYVPLQPFADLFGVKWKIVKSSTAKSPKPWTTTFLFTYPAAYIEKVSTSLTQDKAITTVTLSNSTRVVAAQNGLDVNMNLAAARRANVPSVQEIKDYLVPRTTLSSGNWQAKFALRINYAAPVQWYTLGNPARVVFEVQRLFEEQNSAPLSGGMALTRIRKGTGHGPVQMFLARVDPNDGWRVRVAPAGYSVLQRAQPSILASRHRALLTVNGGFFAYDGAAVGAVLVNGEWIRLPWNARTAIGFRPDGSTVVGNLQTVSHVAFSGKGGPEFRLPVRELNGWPDSSRITALTTRFGPSYKLSPGEMALVVKHGVIVAKPGGGYAPIYAGYPSSFTLVASGGARPYLEKVARGQRAKLSIKAPGWEGVTTALGGGPRLVSDGQVNVTRENFRADVFARGPRTAIGVDRDGRYIILVVDGRQNYYSTGLTLSELAYTMQSLGAVDAINLDGGGSTAMVVKSRVVNRPSDGSERRVANVLMVTR